MKGDPYLINRIVGYFEYSQALRRLSAFVSAATVEERLAAEQIVDDEPEYKVYSLFEPSAPQRPEVREIEDRYDRTGSASSGLARLMALARVEVAAMLAGFAQVPAPFEAVQPMPYDRAAFQEFVNEGARVHYASLAEDPQARAVAEQTPPDERMLAYIRRLNIARHFIRAAGQLAEMNESLAVRHSAARAEAVAAMDRSTSSAAWLIRLKHVEDLFATYTANVNAYLKQIRVASFQRDKIHEQTIQSCFDGVCGNINEVAEGTQTRQRGTRITSD